MHAAQGHAVEACSAPGPRLKEAPCLPVSKLLTPVKDALHMSSSLSLLAG